jgi:pimeloyl-ACP methyl ester carboxylesterase
VDRIQIDANGMTFDGLVAGPSGGEPVVLLHGFPQTAWAFRHQLLALGAAGYRAVAPDQRGYSPGARPTAVEDYAGPLLVGDVLAIADALGFDRFHLVGHDFGGAVAWQVAGRHRERLASLTVLSTPHPRAFSAARRGDIASDQSQRSSYMDTFRQEGSEQLFVADGAAGLRAVFTASGLSAMEAEPYVRALGTEPAMRAALSWYRAAAVVPGLGPITTPTLYIWSTEDAALGREAAEATAGFVDGPYRFVVLEGVGHWIAETAADEVDDLLLEHLRSNPLATPAS